MKRTIAASICVAALLAVAACSGDDSEESAPTDANQTSETSDGEGSPATVESGVGADALAVGEPRVGNTITTTVLEVKDDYRDGNYRAPVYDDPDAMRWLGVNVKLCITGDLNDFGGQPVPLTWSLFEAGTTDGATYPASGSSWNDFPSPQFPTSASITEGCRQGWLLIPVPTGDEPNVIRLVDPGGTVIAEWTF